ncbi:hypothetical protein EUTSA_v10009948mg [Eutrema salsugineum]|uniref:Uncharacterized protein n=1 Tax=Eutrema salsugineum TaxID=72664 RepID=V4L1F6_EUTSA|nr:hypothetical protein EUTSA_v10009948mg [Eutrema salsugineum]
MMTVGNPSGNKNRQVRRVSVGNETPIKSKPTETPWFIKPSGIRRNNASSGIRRKNCVCPAATISIPEITTVPVWLTLNNIPDQLYSILGIKWIASGIREPMLTEKPWLDPTQMGKAKILVEVKLDRPFPKRVALTNESDTITMVDVLCSWLPSVCSGCGQLGHKATRCLLLSAKSSGSASSPYAAEVNVSSKEQDSNSLHLNGRDSLAPDTSRKTSQTGTSNTDPTLLSLPALAGKNINDTQTLKASSKEASTSKQCTSPVGQEKFLRRTFSSSALKTNRFAALDSSEDDVKDSTDDDVEDPPPVEEAEPTDFMTPQGKRSCEIGICGHRGRGRRGGCN